VLCTKISWSILYNVVLKHRTLANKVKHSQVQRLLASTILFEDQIYSYRGGGDVLLLGFSL